MGRPVRLLVAVVAVGALGLMPGCAAAGPSTVDRPSTAATSTPTDATSTASSGEGGPATPTATATLAASGVEKVLVIVEENRSVADVAAHMPFLAGQGRRYATASNYYAIRHPRCRTIW